MLSREVNAANQVANMNLPIPVDRTPSAVLNLPGAQPAIDAAKMAVDQSIATINRKAAEAKKVGDDIVAESGRMRSAIENKRDLTRNYTKEVSEAQVLADIRKEQADALKNKYAANLHSSWLGLWRPLADTSRVGLLVAAIAFGIIAVFSLIYYFWDNLPAFFWWIYTTNRKPIICWNG